MTHNDLALLIHQTLAQAPELDFLLGRLNARLRAPDELIEDTKDKRNRLHVGMIRLGILSRVLKQELQTR